MFIMLVTVQNHKTGTVQLYSVSKSHFILDSSRALLYYRGLYNDLFCLQCTKVVSREYKVRSTLTV